MYHLKQRLLFSWILTLGLSVSLWGQAKFGIRAGVNYTSISGPKELSDAGVALERFEPRLKLGAAATVYVPFSKVVGLYSELSFVQRGMYYRFEHDRAFLRLPNYQNQGELFFRGHKKLFGLNVSNGYVEVPMMLCIKPLNKRFHIAFGPSVGALISSRGLGTLQYTDPNHEAQMVEIDLNYRFLRDNIGETATTLTAFGTSIPSGTRSGRIDGTTIAYPQSVGAYYFDTEKRGAFYNIFDFGLNLDFSFYFTPGVRIGARAYYGLTDVTNNFYNRSQFRLDDNDQPLKREDFDRNLGLQLFIGLQFN